MPKNLKRSKESRASSFQIADFPQCAWSEQQMSSLLVESRNPGFLAVLRLLNSTDSTLCTEQRASWHYKQRASSHFTQGRTSPKPFCLLSFKGFTFHNYYSFRLTEDLHWLQLILQDKTQGGSFRFYKRCAGNRRCLVSSY